MDGSGWIFFMEIVYSIIRMDETADNYYFVVSWKLVIVNIT